jgi:hypothetical protein
VVVDETDLWTEIMAGTPVIVIADGVYTIEDVGGDVLGLKGQQLWAEHMGEVVFEFGVHLGPKTNSGGSPEYAGSELHGIVFDIQDVAHAATQPGDPGKLSAAIWNWDGAANLHVEDCIIHGHGVLEYGMYIGQPDGLLVERVELDGIKHFGIYARSIDAMVTTLNAPIAMNDVRIRDIGDEVNNPTNSQCGISVSHEAAVTRVHLRDIRRCGIVTGEHSKGTSLSYLDIDRIGYSAPECGMGNDRGTAVYLEFESIDTIISDFCVGPETQAAVNSEWDQCVCDPDENECNAVEPGNILGVHAANTWVTRGLSEASFVGVQFGAGTRAGRVDDVTFRNYARAGIVFHNNLTENALWDPCNSGYDAGSTQDSNTFEESEDPPNRCNFTRAYECGPLICESTPGATPSVVTVQPPRKST